MDAVTAPTLRFGPDRRLTALAGLGALIAIVLSVNTNDAPGRLLFAVAAVVLLGYVAGDLIWAPRLAADQTGLRIRTPFTRVDLGWSDVEDVRADIRSRYGLRSTTLEIDAGEVFVVFSRRSLGVDPETAAALMAAIRPR